MIITEMVADSRTPDNGDPAQPEVWDDAVYGPPMTDAEIAEEAAWLAVMEKPLMIGCYFCTPPGTDPCLPNEQLPRREVVGERMGGGSDPYVICKLACGHEMI